MYFEKEYLSTIIGSTNKLFPYASVPSFKIEFQEDLLYSYPVNILTSTNNSKDEIWGEWSTESWAIGWSYETQSSFLLGKQEDIYIFDKDSMQINYRTRFSVDNSGEFDFRKENIEYNHPNLNWGNYKKKVEFYNGKIYLFENRNKSTIPVQKIK
jgi:hypothetical protein